MNRINNLLNKNSVEKEKNLDLNLLIDMAETINKDLKISAMTSLFANKTRPESYSIKRKIAEGGYGDVFLVTKNGKSYAMKRIPKKVIQTNLDGSFFMVEKRLLLKGDSVWILKGHECLQDETFIYFIMDYVEGGDLIEYLKEDEKISDKEVRFYTAEIAYALHKIHELGYIHRDVKPENVLVKKDGHVLLGDFGSAVEMKEKKVRRGLKVGTPDYMCRDLVTDDTEFYDQTVDFWSLGVLIYEMVYGKMPFCADSLSGMYDKIIKIDYEMEGSNCPELDDLITKLLTRREDRLDWEGIKQHPFLKDIDWDNLLSIEPPSSPKENNQLKVTDMDFPVSRNLATVGFKNFIGFTHDPKCVEYLLKNLIGKEKTVKKTDSGLGNLFSNIFPSQEANGTSTEDDMIAFKNMEIEDLNATIEDLREEKDMKVAETERMTASLSKLLRDLMCRKEELDSLEHEHRAKIKQIQQMNEDIQRKSKIINNGEKSGIVEETLKDVINSIERIEIPKFIKKFRQETYWLVKSNTILAQKVRELEQEASAGHEEEVKRKLRIHRTEAKEYEQKLCQEKDARRILEDEVADLKIQLSDLKAEMLIQRSFTVKDAYSRKPVHLELRGTVFRINEETFSPQHIYIRDMKIHENHNVFSDKKRSLCLVIHILSDSALTEASEIQTNRIKRSAKAIEKELQAEQLVLESLELLATVGNVNSSAISAARDKILYLTAELDKARKFTLVDSIVSSESGLHEYKNHLFQEKMVGNGTLCDVCSTVIYENFNTSYYCSDCFYTVHPVCHNLVKYSCETALAIRKGRSLVILSNSVEEKEGIKRLSAF